MTVNDVYFLLSVCSQEVVSKTIKDVRLLFTPKRPAAETEYESKKEEEEPKSEGRAQGIRFFNREDIDLWSSSSCDKVEN